MKALEAREDCTARAAVELLKMLALFHFEGVPEEMFEMATNIFEQRNKNDSADVSSAVLLLKIFAEQQEDWYPEFWRGVLMTLSSLSMIRFDGQSRNISMHPLIHAWTMDRMTKEQRVRAREASLSWIATSIEWNFLGADFTYRRRLPSHIDACCNDKGHVLKSLVANGSNSGIAAASKFALVYEEVGRTQEALELREAVLEIQKRTLDPEHPHLLRSMYGLANSYSEVGRTQDALGLMDQIVKRAKQTNPHSKLYIKSFQYLQDLQHSESCPETAVMSSRGQKLERLRKWADKIRWN